MKIFNKIWTPCYKCANSIYFPLLKGQTEDKILVFQIKTFLLTMKKMRKSYQYIFDSILELKVTITVLIK